MSPYMSYSHTLYLLWPPGFLLCPNLTQGAYNQWWINRAEMINDKCTLLCTE